MPSDGGSIPPASIRNSYEHSELEFLILRSGATKEGLVRYLEIKGFGRGFSFTKKVQDKPSPLKLRINFSPASSKTGSQFMVNILNLTP